MTLARFESLRATMEKSLATLRVISLKIPHGHHQAFVDSVLLEAPNLVEFKLFGLSDVTVSVQVKNRPRTGGLKTLWIPSLDDLPKERPNLFQNLGSLKVIVCPSQSEWRERGSKSLSSISEASKHPL